MTDKTTNHEVKIPRPGPAPDATTLADLRRKASEAADETDRLRISGAPRADISKAKAAQAIAERALKTAEQEIKAAEQAARAQRRAPRPQRPNTGEDVPVIDVTSERDGTQALIEVLESGQIPEVYLYGEGPTQVGRSADGPTIKTLDADGMAYVMMTQADVIKVKTTKDGDEVVTSVLLPPRVANVALRNPRWDLPVLRGISSVPLLLPDGTFQTEPGYNEGTGYYYEPKHSMPPVPASPSAAQIKDARKLIVDDLLGDFPWKERADKASYLAVLFYAPLRVLVRDPVMFYVLTATNPGSGKSLLATILESLYGVHSTTWPSDNTEMSKVVTALLSDQAEPILSFSNLPNGHVIRYPVLSELVTKNTWSGRRLGSSKMISVPNGRLLMADGNNISASDDMPRRAIWTRLDPDVKPETRDAEAFALGDLNDWLPLNSHKVLHAVLTLLAGWVADGMPRSSHSIASFGAWPRTLGGILGWLGVEGWLEGREELTADGDDDGHEWTVFLAAWHGYFGDKLVGAGDVLLAADTDHDAVFGKSKGPLTDAIPRDKGTYLPSRQKLGYWLKAREGRWFGPYRLRKVKDTHAEAWRWRVDHAAPAADPETEAALRMLAEGLGA